MRKSPTIKSRSCVSCGAVYVPTGNRQMYCSSCRIEQKHRRQHEYEMHKYPDRKPKQKSTEVCCICGEPFSCSYEGKPYCNKHYLRMYNNGTVEPKQRRRTNTYKIMEGITIVTTGNGRTFTVDTADLEAVQHYSWCYSKTGYLVANIRGKVTKLHRYLLQPDAEFVIDHINGDPSDNRRCNLRLCSRKENARNSAPSRSSKTGIVGVKIVSSGKYVAQIMVDRKQIILGTFDTLEAASEARKQAEQHYFSEFSPTISRTSTSTPGMGE